MSAQSSMPIYRGNVAPGCTPFAGLREKISRLRSQKRVRCLIVLSAAITEWPIALQPRPGPSADSVTFLRSKRPEEARDGSTRSLGGCVILPTGGLGDAKTEKGKCIWNPGDL